MAIAVNGVKAWNCLGGKGPKDDTMAQKTCQILPGSSTIKLLRNKIINKQAIAVDFSLSTHRGQSHD